MEVINWIFAHVDFLTLLAALPTGIIALFKWSDQIRQRRVEKTKELVCKVRDDKDIALIMDFIDWNNGILYDGNFRCTNSAYSISDGEFSRLIDKTLTHYSYICYLNKVNVIKGKEMSLFEYELMRFTSNEHISNYLFSIYHWSKYLKVTCTFEYLIEYSLKKKYLKEDFKIFENSTYKCFLRIPNIKN